MLLDCQTYQSFLSEELARRMKRNPRYSQRAFARHLGLRPGELSEILKRKRALSLKSALRMSRSLGLSAAETQHLFLLIHKEKSEKLARAGRIPDDLAIGAEAASLESRRLTQDMFHVIADWYNLAILNLGDCEDFRWDAGWIAQRLGISKIEVEVALERLERLGLIERDAGGALRVCQDYVISPSGIPSEAIRENHRQLLGKAIDALDGQGVDEREMSGIGFAINPRDLPRIKKEISDFQDQLVAKYSRGKRSEVYYLELALFRLTNKTGDKR